MEFKYTDAPKKTKSIAIAISDLGLEHLWIVYPGKESYKLDKNISVFLIKDLSDTWKYPL